MHRYILSYGEADHNIKIELNARIRKANTYETVNFFGTAIQAMEKSTIFANKLVAIIDRSNPTSRDLRDVHFFFRNHFPINEEVISERTGLEPKQFFLKLKSYIQTHFPNKYLIDANLGMVLNDSQKSWVRKSLLAEIVSYIDLMVFELQ